MKESFDFGGEFVWYPPSETIENANLTRFMRKHKISDYAELMARSTSDISWFTAAVLDFLDIRFYEPYEEVVRYEKDFHSPEWCVGGKMNIVYNCLEKYIGTDVEDRIALRWESEGGRYGGMSRTITYKSLNKHVSRFANGLRSIGVQKGDVVGVYMPMVSEIVIAVLAIAKIGAVILPLFSGYGPGAVATRLKDADAKVLITADGFYRREKIVYMKPIADEAVSQVPTVEKVVVFNYIWDKVDMQPERDIWWNDLLLHQSSDCETERTSAEDLLMVIYTSGTTGRPKGAVHTHCGFPIKAAQDMAFGTNVQPGDVIYWMTDMGWMMGPWLVFGALLLGATFFIYDGAPDYPGPDRIWSMVSEHQISVLGISPTLIRALVAHGLEPVKRHDLSSLKLFASTGEPWNPEPWRWLFEQVGESKRPIVNYSGGTEISGGIVMGNPVLPLKPTAFSGACPGIAADVLNDQGESVTGEVGELVIKAPWIGMTRGFWKDPERYLETYWSRWPNVWVHGDFAARDADGMWYILGRSDDTIKVAGKRLGPAEVESVVVAHPDVLEAAAIGVPHPVKGSAVVLFCVLSKDVSADESLRTALHEMVVAAMGKPMAPKSILFVRDLPKTRNAKVMRRMVRAAYLGEDPGDTSSLVNPEAVAEIAKAA